MKQIYSPPIPRTGTGIKMNETDRRGPVKEKEEQEQEQEELEQEKARPSLSYCLWKNRTEQSKVKNQKIVKLKGRRSFFVFVYKL